MQPSCSCLLENKAVQLWKLHAQLFFFLFWLFLAYTVLWAGSDSGRYLQAFVEGVSIVHEKTLGKIQQISLARGVGGSPHTCTTWVRLRF